MVEVECLLLRFITCNEFRHLKWLNKIDKNGEKNEFPISQIFSIQLLSKLYKKNSRNLKKIGNNML